MPRAYRLNSPARRRLASQLSTGLGHRGASLRAGGRKLSLGETFELWTVTAESLAHPERPIATTARRLPYFHHQIGSADRVEDYARSKRPNTGDGAGKVHVVGTSGIAAKIDRGVRQIDGLSEFAKSNARLLFVPSVAMTALWLETKDQTDKVLVLEVAHGGKNIIEGQLYDGPHFLAALAALVGPLSSERRRPPPKPRKVLPPSRANN